ncbi:hypothetical protein COOONC_16290, partial [Cooperia oncophora]
MDGRRGTSSTPQDGTVVLLWEPTQPRSAWIIGRIVQIRQDSEGTVREVLVELPNKHRRTPINPARVEVTLNDENTRSCRFYSTSRVMIPAMDQEICLSLQHEDHTYGYLKLRSKEVYLTCQSEIAYWTFDPHIQCMNENYCPSLSNFCTMSGCSPAIDEYMQSDKFGQMIKLGRCRNMPPDIANQLCFFAPFQVLFSPQACFLTIASLDPEPGTITPTIFCDSWSVSADLQIIMNLNTSQVIKDFTLSQHSSYIDDKMKLELVSKNIPQWVSLPDCYIRNHDNIYGTTCNQRGTFVLDKLGTIQCPSEADAHSFTKNCKFNQEIVEFQDSNCILRTPLISKLPDAKKLPLVRPEFYLYHTNGSIRAKLSSSFSIESQLVLSGLSVNVEYVRPTCVFHKLKFDGCFNCATGVLVTIDLVVTSRGVVNILCPEVPLTIPLSVNKYHQKDLNLMCQLLCSNVIQLQLTGTLRNGDIIIDDPSGRTHHGTTVVTKSFWSSSLDNVLTFVDTLGIGSVYRWIQLAILLTIALMIVIMLAYATKTICSCLGFCRSKKDVSDNLMQHIKKVLKKQDDVHKKELKKERSRQ